MADNKLLAEWFWIDRWMGSSAFLLPLEPRGLYREMLTQAWRREARLPNDHEAIRRAAGITEAEWSRSWPHVEKYWRVDGAHLVNDTQLAVYAEARAAQEKASERGKKGAQARAQARAQAEPELPLEHEPLSPDPSPSQDPELTPTPNGNDSGATRRTFVLTKSAIADEVVACWNTRSDGDTRAVASASHVGLVDKLIKANYRREEILLVALVAAHHEQGKYYRGRSGNSGLLMALDLGGRPKAKGGTVSGLTRNHFATLLELPLIHGPRMAKLLEEKGLAEAAKERGWKLRAA